MKDFRDSLKEQFVQDQSEESRHANSEPKKTWEEYLTDGECSSLSLATTKIQPREPIFDDWCLVGDLGFIFAARGLGKTWLSMHLAHGAATKSDVGPWKTHKKLKVLYLDGEMPPQDIQFRDRALGSPTEDLVYVNHQILFDRTGKIMNLANPDFQNGILEHCQTKNFGLLCLDNLSTLASGIDENKSIDWEIIQPWLLRVRRSLITVLFIHHAGRNNQMRGSSKREDPASWVLRLDSPIDINECAGAHFISRFTKWRSEKQPKTYEWIYEPNANGEVIVEVKDASPLNIFRSHVENGLDTCTMISEEMDISPGHVSRLATKAVREGWLEISHRKYVMKA
jgi:putative DNA primase/helicase